MIKRIDIKKFGSFNNFNWNASMRDGGNNVVELKLLNILYGRNYSGKTTLSRIVRCMETRRLPRSFEDGKFSITTDTGTVNQTNLATPQHVVRVYNKDFVDDNLGFLRDHDGNIQPFAIVGAENNTIETEIETRRTSLGSEAEKTGLKGQLVEKSERSTGLSNEVTDKERTLEGKLTEKANRAPNGIKHNPIYRDPNYTVVKLKRDIAAVLQAKIVPMTEEERIPKIALLSESSLPDIPRFSAFIPRVTFNAVSELLQRRVAPQKPIEDLLANPKLQDWVRTGISLNEERTTCGFCGADFKEQFWSDLKAHFDEASEAMASDIDQLLELIRDDRKALSTLADGDRGKFYADISGEADAAFSQLFAHLKEYAANLKSAETALEKRRTDLFNVATVPAMPEKGSEIESAFVTINEIIQKNNLRTNTLGQDQDRTRNHLRLSEIAQFISDIGYSAESTAIELKREEAVAAATETTDARSAVNAIESEIDELQKRLRDEKKGAEKVNEYLRNFFGHDGLRLEAEEDTTERCFRFKIMRGQGQAFNLSEGECSLVAFCYFIAKLEDVDATGRQLIVYIDDPISSLDNNHIFFVYSLIQSTLFNTRVERITCKQLFISTHNLEFLKLLKRLPRPARDKEHFLVSSNRNLSTIGPMPTYLRHYVTEFNFLFQQICLCSSTLTTPDEHGCFYNFGNNMRKFLEIYLFFKYPSGTNPDGDNDDRIGRFFTDDGQGVMVQRLTNEYSHLGGAFDRGITPIDRHEIARVADFVLQRMRAKDPEQFEALLRSVELEDPFLVAAPAEPEHTLIPL